jgi:Zn-dependent protease
LLLAGVAGPVGWLGTLARFLVIINIILGGFNMIPVPPLDGSKIMAWSSAAWGGIVAGILALAMVYWTIPPF